MPSVDSQRPRACVVAAGRDAVELAARWQYQERLQDAETLVISHEVTPLEEASGTRRVLLERDRAAGQPRATALEQRPPAREREVSRIARELQDIDVVFVLVDTADPAGLPAAELVASALQQRSDEPFLFSFAVLLVADRRAVAEPTPTELDGLCEELGGHALATGHDAFHVIDALWAPISATGVICYDTADLLLLLTERQRWRCAVCVGPLEQPGELAERALEQLVAQGLDLARVDRLQLVMDGGSRLSLHAIDRVASSIVDALPAEAHMLYQALVQEDESDTLRIRVLASMLAT